MRHQGAPAAAVRIVGVGLIRPFCLCSTSRASREARRGRAWALAQAVGRRPFPCSIQCTLQGLGWVVVVVGTHHQRHAAACRLGLVEWLPHLPRCVRGTPAASLAWPPAGAAGGRQGVGLAALCAVGRVQVGRGQYRAVPHGPFPGLRVPPPPSSASGWWAARATVHGGRMLSLVALREYK